MFTLLVMTMFIVFLIIFGSLFSLALKASWGIVKNSYTNIKKALGFIKK